LRVDGLPILQDKRAESWTWIYLVCTKNFAQSRSDVAGIVCLIARLNPKRRIGLISPPVGMNLFVLNSLLPKVGLINIFRGCWPFVLVMIVVLGLLIAFPQLSLWLPSLMK
jgi:TRAP-type C4-dicarboxylate transport system permease large subunit